MKVKKIRIEGHDFSIKEADEIIHFDEEGNKAQHDGWIEYSPQTIEIRKNVHPQCKMETYIHEVFHGINKYRGLNLNEQGVETISNALYRILTENPRFWKELLGW